MAYNPALERLKNQAEQRRYNLKMQQQEAYEVRSLFDPIFNVKAREKAGGFFKAYGKLFDNNFAEWFRNPGQALVNNLTLVGDTMDVVANLVKAPVIAIAKDEDVGERLKDAYGLGDNGRTVQNMSELREVIGATASGLIGGISSGALIGGQIGGPWGILIGAGVGLVVGGTAGIVGDTVEGAHIANTITDFTLEYIADPLNVISGVAAISTAADAAKIAKAGTQVANIADISADTVEAATTAARKGISNFLSDATKGVNKDQALNYLITNAAKKSISGTKASKHAKVFKNYKNRIINSYFNNKYDDFQKVIFDLDLAGPDGLTPTHRKIMFDVLKKDANMSRASKVLNAFSKIDDTIAKVAWSSTPVGLAGKAIIKSPKALSKITQNAVGAAKAKKFANNLDKLVTEPLAESKQTPEIFKFFDENNITYKVTKEMTDEDKIKLYKTMNEKADELSKIGKTAEANVLKSMSRKINFDNGVQSGSIASMRSELNKIIRDTVIKFKGDFDKAISDPGVIDAYNKITNMLYYDIGQEEFIKYITDASYNKELYNYLKNMDSVKALMDSIGSSKNGGAHVILAEIMTGIAKKAMEEDPNSVYIKMLNDMSNDLTSQHTGIAGAYKKLNASTIRLQKAIEHKYGIIEAYNGVQKELKNIYSMLKSSNSLGVMQKEIEYIYNILKSSNSFSDAQKVIKHLYDMIKSSDDLQKEIGRILDALKSSNSLQKEIEQLYDMIKSSNSFDDIESEIKHTYDMVKSSKNFGDVQKYKYNKAIVDVGSRDYKLSTKDYLEPKDYQKLYQVRSDYKALKRRQALLNFELEEFAKVANLKLEKDFELPKLKRIISEHTTTAYSKMQSIQQDLAAMMEHPEISGYTISKTLKDAAEHANRLLEGLPADINDIPISKLVSIDPTAARIHRTLNSLKNNYPDESAFIKDLRFQVEYIDQVEFSSKNSMYRAHVEDAVNNITNSKELKKLNSIIKDIKGKDRNAIEQKVFEYLIQDTNADNFISGKLLDVCNDIKNKYLSVQTLSVFNDTLELYNSRISNSVRGISNKLQRLNLAYTSALDITQPCKFSYTYATSMDVISKAFNGSESDAFKLFNNYFDNNTIDQTIHKQLLTAFEMYKGLGARMVQYFNDTIKELDVVKYYREFRSYIDEVIENNTRIYTSAVFAKQCLKADVLKLNPDVEADLSKIFKLITDDKYKADTPENKLIRMRIYKNYATKFKDEMYNSLFRAFKRKDNLTGSFITDIDMPFNDPMRIKDGFNALVKNPKRLINFFNSLPTSVKSVEALKYISNGAIKDYINGQSVIFKQNMSSLISLLTDMAHRNIDPSADELTKYFKNMVEVVDNIEIALSNNTDEFLKSMAKDTADIKIIKNNRLNSDYSSDFLSKYTHKTLSFAEDFRVSEVDHKIFKLVSSNGEVKDLPKWTLRKTPLDRALFGDLETHLGFTPTWKPTADDVIQISFTGADNKFNALILDPKYSNYGNTELLDSSYINGEMLLKYNPEGYTRLTKGLSMAESWTDELGNTYTLYADRNAAGKALADYLKPYIIEHSGGKYLYIIGQNSTNFDDPVIIDLLKRYGGIDLEGIISEDSLYLIRALQGLAQLADLDGFARTEDIRELLNILKDSSNAKLSNIYEKLLGSERHLVKDLSGVAHDASYDIQMTREIVNAIHNIIDGATSKFGGSKNIQDIKYNFDRLINGQYHKNVVDSLNKIRSHVEKFLEECDDVDFIRRKFNSAIGRIPNHINLSNPKSIVALQTFIDNTQNLQNYIDAYNLHNNEVAILNSIFSEAQGIGENLNRLMVTRRALAEGVYGDATVYAKVNNHYANEYILNHYPNFRNNETFLEWMSIFNGENIENPKTLMSEVLRYQLAEGQLSDQFEVLKSVYDYTKRIDNFYYFNDKLNKYLAKTMQNANDADSVKLRQAYSRILDKLWGYGTKDDTRSLDSWLIKRISEFSSADDIKKVKNELKLLITAEGKLDLNKFFGDIKDDIELIDSSGAMLKDIMKYVNDCIENLEQYNIFTRMSSRRFNDITILRPTPDRQYADNFTRAYKDIIGKFKDATNYLPDEKEVRIKSLENELQTMTSSIRDPLTYVKQINNKYTSLGGLPEGYINEKLGKNTWQINGSLDEVSFSHRNRTSEYYVNANIRDKILEILDVKFDPNIERESIKFRPEESNTIRIIRNFREESGLYINEVYDLLKEFNFVNMDYKLNKIKMYADFYDEIEKELPEAYTEFAKGILDANWRYLDEATQKNIELKAKYEQFFKAVAYSAYIASDKDLSIYDTIKSTKVLNDLTKNLDSFDMKNYIYNNTSHSLKEYRQQFVKLFQESDGSINYNAMYDYVKNNKYLEFVYFTKSNKYFKRDEKTGKFLIDKTTGKYVNAAEINIAPVDSPERLKQFLNDPRLSADDAVGEYDFSILDKNTIEILRTNIQHRSANRRYKSATLNKLIDLRNKIMRYISAPYKTLSLYNIGFTVTNMLEGAYKTFISTTGNRFDTVRQYGNAMRIHRDWVNLSTDIAKATQGSPYYRMADQLKLLYTEQEIGKLIFSNWGDVLNGQLPKIRSVDEIMLYATAKLDQSNKYLPKYIVKDFIKKIEKGFFNDGNISEYASRFRNVNDLINSKLPSYDLDEFKVMTNFINSPAAAAEFQSIKKASELNIIGRGRGENALERAFNTVMYSDSWLGGKKNPLNYISPYANLSYNSNIEVINRFAMYLDLVEKGYANDSALNKVLATHFNYGNKSQLEMTAELLIPFISFPLRNFIFWAETLDEHPTLIKHFVDAMICNWGDEKDNQYNQSKITRGGIRLWNDVSVESGLSLFEAMALGGNALSTASRKVSPLAAIPIEAVKEWNIGESQLQYQVSRLPIISQSNNIANLAYSLEKGTPKLYDIAPSLFNEVYKKNRYYYNNQDRYAYKSAYSRMYYSSGKYNKNWLIR